jgi:hypothetical protein
MRGNFHRKLGLKGKGDETRRNEKRKEERENNKRKRENKRKVDERCVPGATARHICHSVRQLQLQLSVSG